MIINLTGPPAAGKTLLAERFVLEHPEYTYLSIDNYRIEFKNEETAWYELMISVINSPNVILESSGLSWKLKNWIFQHPAIQGQEIKTVILYGNDQDFLDRLRKRNRPDVPFKYTELKIEELVEVCRDKLNTVYPGAYQIRTDSTQTIEEEYAQFKEVIIPTEKRE
jgi:hypothetical protein